MAHCPNCGHECRGTPDRCPECHQALAPEAPVRPTPGEELGNSAGYVPLLTLSDPAEALVPPARLDEAGIPVVMETHGPINPELAAVEEDVEDDYAMLLVPPDRLDEARELIESSRREPPQWPPGMEPQEGN